MTVVFKLGGSLLTFPGLAEKLQCAINLCADKRAVVLTGGGASADVVRDWSRIHRLDEEEAHWLAIFSLDLNRRLLETLLPWRTVISRVEAEDIWINETVPLHLDFHRFVISEEAEATEPLPHNWNVTSDSLAAWTALCWPADELVLLKSIPLPDGLSVQEASDQLLVDSCFPGFAERIGKISWCDLRAPKMAIHPWRIN